MIPLKDQKRILKGKNITSGIQSKISTIRSQKVYSFLAFLCFLVLFFLFPHHSFKNLPSFNRSYLICLCLYILNPIGINIANSKIGKSQTPKPPHQPKGIDTNSKITTARIIKQMFLT